ncbi:DUF402 domain-containing protein [Paenibacillus sp. N1-5-1-14]|uniref:DUF402 domain-containing protein n=1 Tax=Paenibacillus radicibacter TaxID=2972488 RepID=UPI0021594D33|nr:DUF402 domain-containing protein [Paenibacillus radicibacter]MCR8644384.1 DUF402 domain-containing protein [Paenibacillus radicibacter]
MQQLKQKAANRPNWSRIIEKRYVQKYIQDDQFKGYITLLYLDLVHAPLSAKYENHEICIVDNGYSWLMFFPDEEKYSLTVMRGSEGQVLQYYFDIVKSTYLTSEGIPAIDDLFLDLIILPSGEYYIKDEDELEKALQDGVITQEDYILARTELERLLTQITRQKQSLINEIKRYIEVFN